MQRFLRTLGVCLLGGAALTLLPAAARAQVICVDPAPVVTRYYAAPAVAVPAPAVSYYAAPSVSYYAAPAVTYRPAVNYSYYPATTAYYPATTVYAAPAAVAVPAGTVETRTYRGFGIFRPRGLYTETYVRP